MFFFSLITIETSISAMSSKPDNISSIIVLPETEIQGYSSPIYNTLYSTKGNDILTLRTLPVDRVATKHRQSNENF